MPYLKRQNAVIHYEICGDGEPLVLIMGLGAALAAWEPHRSLYQQYFRCISVDNRGVGSSRGGTNGLTTSLMAEDIDAILNAENLKSVHIAGISMGGCIAQMFAIQHPNQVRSLLLVNTFAQMDLYMRRAFETLRIYYGVGDPLVYDRLVQTYIYAQSTFAEHPDILIERERISDNTQFGMNVEDYHSQCDACLLHSSTSLLNRITAPVLVVGGKEDLLTPPRCSIEIARNIPNASLFINKGGHVQHYEHMDIFNRTSLSFLLSHCCKERL